MRIPAIVLAAGGSTRCPGGKLLRLYRGRPLLTWTLENICSVETVDQVILVCGHQEEGVRTEAAPFAKVLPVTNPHWRQGIASSLTRGLALVPANAPGALVALGDTPFFRRETTLKVLPAPTQKNEIRFPSFQGVPGHPKYFPAWLFEELMKLTGDQGAKLVLEKRRDRCVKIETEDEGTIRDFDRLEDFGARSSGPASDR